MTPEWSATRVGSETKREKTVRMPQKLLIIVDFAGFLLECAVARNRHGW
jgi:hypothetical protein